MAGREVERVEVVVRRLDLATVDDAVAQAEEDVLHLAPDLRDQVQLAAAVPTDGQRHVDALRGQPGVELGALQLGLAGIDRRLEPLAHGVEGHPGLAVAHLAERLLERALATEILDPHDLDPVGRRRGRGGGKSLALECVGVHEGSSLPTRSPGPNRSRPSVHSRSWRSTTR